MALPRFASCRCSREGGGGCLGLFKMAASRNQPNPHVMVWLSPAPLDTPRSKSLQMQLGWILAILTDSCFNIPLLVEQSCLRAPDTSQTSSLLQRVCPKIHPNLRELGGNLFVFFVFWGLFDFIFLFVSTNLGDKAAVNNLCPSTVIYSPAPYITGRYLGRSQSHLCIFQVSGVTQHPWTVGSLCAEHPKTLAHSILERTSEAWEGISRTSVHFVFISAELSPGLRVRAICNNIHCFSGSCYKHIHAMHCTVQENQSPLLRTAVAQTYWLNLWSTLRRKHPRLVQNESWIQLTL